MTLKSLKLAIVGDFNICAEDVSDQKSLSPLATLKSIDFNKLITAPIHVAGHCLDLLHTNNIDFHTVWSDYSVLFFSSHENKEEKILPIVQHVF